MEDIKILIEKAWDDRSLLYRKEYQESIRSLISLVDRGECRVAEPTADGSWNGLLRMIKLHQYLLIVYVSYAILLMAV